ncbi:MAG: hypothetical protein JXR70_02630 [Spirochaetales bacterium]|nr:hypothetical protein [Spirochaetales bacterium]
MKNLTKLILGLSILAAASSCLSIKPVATEIFNRRTKAMVHPITYAGFYDKNTLLTVGPSGSVFHSNDGGKTLTSGKINSACLFGLEILSEKNAWACGNKAFVRLTTTSGSTWDEAADFGDWEPHQCRYLSFLDMNTGWIASPTLLAATQDGGKSWQEIPLPSEDIKISAIQLRSPQNGYVFDDFSGVLYITNDQGQTWIKKPCNYQATKNQSQSSPTAIIHFEDEKTGIIIFDDFSKKEGWVVLKTTNSGNKWQKSQLNLPKGYIYLSRHNLLLTITTTLGEISAYTIDGLF